MVKAHSYLDLRTDLWVHDLSHFLLQLNISDSDTGPLKISNNKKTISELVIIAAITTAMIFVLVNIVSIEKRKLS